jgi:hypothetical protein
MSDSGRAASHGARGQGPAGPRPGPASPGLEHGKHSTMPNHAAVCQCTPADAEDGEGGPPSVAKRQIDSPRRAGSY